MPQFLDEEQKYMFCKYHDWNSMCYVYNTFVYLIKYSKINIHIESENCVESILVKHILNISIYENHYSIF